MAKPVVAIVGRPNVGKSSFFNKLCGQRISIVDNVPGVTRDRIYADTEWCGKKFTIIDTGGLDAKSDDAFQGEIAEQVQVALDIADVIVMLVDGRTGVTLADEMLAKKLRKGKTPVLLVVNKLDNYEVENTYDFYELGLGTPFAVSCEQSKGIGDVLDEIIKNFEEKDFGEEDDGILKIAIVGRPNVGKSSIVNRLLGEKRVVVSDIEGTTRDSVYVPFKYNKKIYELVDTAGLRRSRGVEQGSVESYSVIRTKNAIERADVVIITFDASQKLSEQDVRVAGYVHESGKPSVVLLNKIDLLTSSRGDVLEKVKQELSYMDYFYPVFVSAKTGAKLGDIMPAVLKAYENGNKRIPTGALNDLLQDCILNYTPPAKNGRRLKLNYITQASILPPTFVVFVNDGKLVNFAYERYLENRFRERIDFGGTPIKFVFKTKEDK